MFSEHGWDAPQARAAGQRLLALERGTAAEMGLPYAEPAGLAVQWDAGAPMPVLIVGLRTFVAFYIPGSRDDHGIGVVEFKGVESVMMGSPNDEVLQGHPLWGSGLEFYRPQQVRNSPWIADLIRVNRVHSQFREDHWSAIRHFLLPFHDETIECAAREAVTSTEPAATMAKVVADLSARSVS